MPILPYIMNLLVGLFTAVFTFLAGWIEEFFISFVSGYIIEAISVFLQDSVFKPFEEMIKKAITDIATGIKDELVKKIFEKLNGYNDSFFSFINEKISLIENDINYLIYELNEFSGRIILIVDSFLNPIYGVLDNIDLKIDYAYNKIDSFIYTDVLNLLNEYTNKSIVFISEIVTMITNSSTLINSSISGIEEKLNLINNEKSIVCQEIYNSILSTVGNESIAQSIYTPIYEKIESFTTNITSPIITKVESLKTTLYNLEMNITAKKDAVIQTLTAYPQTLCDTAYNLILPLKDELLNAKTFVDTIRMTVKENHALIIATIKQYTTIQLK